MRVWILLLCGLLAGCSTGFTTGRVMIRAGGFAELRRGNVGETYFVENEGPGHVNIRDLGRGTPDQRLYEGEYREYRGPLDLLIAGEGGVDAIVKYESRD